MPRLLRIEYAGAIYHITIRGNARADIFRDDGDRRRFLKRLSESVDTYGVRLFMFCLMNNHVHLVLETPIPNLQRFMQSLETGYTVYYNQRHKMIGHLFQGRYKAKLVEGDRYLLKLSRYVHLNPIHVGDWREMELSRRKLYLRNYLWSSYRSYIGHEKLLKFVTYGPVLTQTGVRKSRQTTEYRKFVEGGLAETDEEFREILKKSGGAIGDDEFLEWVRERNIELASKAAKPEDVSFRKEVTRLNSDDVLELVGHRLGVAVESLREKRRDSALRPVAARMLAKYCGLTNRQTAGVLGLKSGVAVGLQVRKAAVLMTQDDRVARLITSIEDELECLARNNLK